ncbi:MAG TPA: hypothetical protein VLA60_09585 [Nitrospirales bacterium]|nr:hypothetical protein [Nitrospirales bacterium]
MEGSFGQLVHTDEWVKPIDTLILGNTLGTFPAPWKEEAGSLG